MSEIEKLKVHQREYNRLLSAQVEAIASGDTSMRQHESGTSWWGRFTFPLRMYWWGWRERWRYRPSRSPALAGQPMTHEDQRQAGYSPASKPMPWTEDITRHNAQVSRAYKEDVLARKAAMSRGEYTPRFLCCDPLLKTDAGAITPEDVNWDLEMTLRPHARVEVTGTAPRFARVTPEQIADIKAEQMARHAVTAAATHSALPESARAAIGSRASILQAVGGNEALADQVEQQAREFFGVEDLDAPLVKREMTPAEQAFDTAVKNLHDGGDGYLYDREGKRIGIID